jgi:hypothetical protein
VLSPASLLIASSVYRTDSSLASTTMPGAQQFDDPVTVRVGRAQRG